MKTVRCLGDLQHARNQWITECLGSKPLSRDAAWTESLALGSASFVEDVKNKLGITAKARRIVERDDIHILREPAVSYDIDFNTENAVLSEIYAVNPAG